MRLLLVTALVSILGLGCSRTEPPEHLSRARAPTTTPPAGASQTAMTPPPSNSRPIPEEAREGVRQARLLGEMLYLQDAWAARATDRMTEEGILRTDNRLRGWIITHEGEGGTARFIGEGGAGLVELYRVVFSKRSPREDRFERVDPAPPLSPSLGAHFKARQTALESGFKRFTESYNTVTLPASLVGETGWLVYLLAATTSPDEVLIGGHTRCRVSENGEKVLALEPLSRSILRLPSADRIEVVSHIVSAWPLETHVFASLLYRRRFQVLTNVGLWDVNGGDIAFLGDER